MTGLFDEQSKLYASARPSYSPDWYSKLASLTPHHILAWDVRTGNGQAAVGVRLFFLLKILLLLFSIQSYFDAFSFDLCSRSNFDALLSV
ncbi:hypothetical protein AXF42_Ash003929 [Apostasia shenzhenica]|uniref:Uncharacterized protein n=1 Tax=Apostasia shenzhenica TaxID=1088818 RepID=A0A2I0AIA6_9ASPA|nr:hypothetical protein AXF42_Ash003929 [Apostasia shenzhenica]